jgi:enediyne polyketide synthase
MHVPDEVTTGAGQPVAIAGAALRFPGASDPFSFHELAVAGRQMFRALGPGAAGEPTMALAGRRGATTRRPPPLAALLDDTIPGLGRDDELTGGITVRHVLAAQTATAALADVPPVGRALAGGRIGVFFADLPEPGTADVAGWVRRQLGLRAATDGALVAGSREAAGRASGQRPALPSLQDLILGAIDAVSIGYDANETGSATGPEAFQGAGVLHGAASGGLHCSLRAVAAACEALSAGHFDLVLAGGVATGVGGWLPTAAPSPAGIRLYDTRPTGMPPGEGCGVVALMRAADARAAGVPGYAEIAGWDYAGPEGAERAVLPEAYRRAGIDPATVQLVEGHGAATAADDLAELTALLEVLGPRPGGRADRCALGSVTANIGDTRAAAGVAALLKAAFAMTADIIPPVTGCVRPNRLLRGAAVPLWLPAAAEQWPQTPVQVAAVNSLGTAPSPDEPRSGPVHVVLRRERDPAHRPGRRRRTASPPPANGTAGTAPAQPG